MKTDELLEKEYPLSPLQEGMLFHSLYSGQSGVDISQLICDWREGVNETSFNQAWQQMAERHTILRTSFIWEGQETPRQREHEQVRLPVRQKDWSGLSSPAQEERFEELLQADRQCGFDLSVAPLMRVTLTRLGPAHYRFVWTIHHLLSDNVTVLNLLNELFAIYQSLQSGRPLRLKPTTTYRDYVTWLQDQDWTAAERYYRPRLKGFTTPTSLPVRGGGNNGPPAGGRWAEVEILLSGNTVRTLREVAKANGFTLNTFLQGAWGVVLSRYSGEEDVVFGAVKSCRHLPISGAELIAGPFINTLPIRVRCVDDEPLLQWLKPLREQWVELRPYEHSPLVNVQSWSQVPAGRPLFQTILNVLDPPWDAALRASWSNREFRIRNQPNYPLALDIYVAETARLTLVYDAELFERPVMSRMLGHLRTVLESMAHAPQQRVGDLPLLTDVERTQLLEQWNDTGRNFASDDCVHRLFEAQARRNPNALAVASGGVRITYGQLNERANRVAHRLRELGVRAESRVGICMERSAENVISLLGILKAGGAFVPLDPEYPRGRLAFMIADAKLQVLLTQQKLTAKLPVLPSGTHLLCLEEMEADPAAAELSDPASQTNLKNLAYVIYTSGSTGTPKGVEIEHQGLLNLVRWHQEQYQVRSEDRATQLAGLSFDASVWELWPYLTAGASVHVPDEKTRLNPDELVQWLAGEKITLAFLPTPLAEALLDGAWPKGMALRALLTGGDRLHRYPRKKLPFQLVNHYGPTENSVVTTAAVIEFRQECDDAPPIGRPIANTRLYVLDARMRPVPVGVPGELYIAGAGLARGYLNQPKLTAEKFVANPFSKGGPFDRMYRTGDLLRYREDGSVEFLGRIDQQVKLRGYRIELGEIEAVLNGQAGVREAVVVARQDGETRLAAYIVPDQTRSPTAQQLREYLKQKLPEHMVPSAFVFLDALPLTPNGKVDRKGLPAPDFQPLERDFVAPRNPAEKVLADIWSELLHLKRVGVHDNFFELGGHSLMATQMISRVRNAFGAELPMLAVFETPTVEKLAERLTQAGVDRSGSKPVAPRVTDPRSGASLGEAPHKGDKDGEVELSFGQERLWFLEQLEPGLAVYNVPIGIALQGPLNVPALERSVNALAARHGSFRTSFGEVEGCPKARRTRGVKVNLPVVELEHFPDDQQHTELQRLMADEAAQPFDLNEAPLLRAKLFRLGRRNHLLLLTTHHLVSDGWTMAILYRELQELYEAHAQGRTLRLPELPLEFSDYASWQREWLQGEVLEDQLAYWKQQLRGPLPALDLPVDHPRPTQQSYRGDARYFALSNKLCAALKAICRREDITLFMLLLGAFQTLLHRYSGQDDIVTGTTVAGRTRSEIEGLAGLFLNTLALRTDLSGDVTFQELLQRVKKVALDAYAHQDVPFEKVVEAVGGERDLSRAPVFQAMFILQKAPLPTVQAGDMEWSPVPVHNGASKFDLTLSLEEAGEHLSGYLEYNRALFEPDTVSRMLDHLQTLLEGVVANANQKLSELPLLASAEREQLLVEWNGARTKIPDHACIHKLFEEQTARTPEAAAVVFENQTLTYRELNQRADALAGDLQALRVGSDLRVGLCVNRSLEMIVGLLGVLKAGGCYVPLDPVHPQDRVVFMLEDSQASVLLTQQPVRDLFKFEIQNLKVVCLGTQPDVPNPKSEIRIPNSKNPAYLIYTSGSTGKPKGVVVPHRAVVNFLTTMAREPGLKADDVLVAVTTLSFDIAVLELLLPLTVGARVVIANPDEVVDGNALRSLLVRHRATVMQATPVTWRLLLEAGWKPRRGFKALVGGEALPADLADELLACGVELWNMYGPTETTVWSTCARVADTDHGITIGKPIANTTVRILDQGGKLCPIGVPGEMYIGGDGVALGYWNRPELTAERFIPDPFSGETERGQPGPPEFTEGNRRSDFAGDLTARTRPSALFYRTGDLARWRSDGTLEHLGRLDFQVKLRGFRIELGEIEANIAQDPTVREVAVIAREDAPEDKRLVAYVVAENAPADLVDQLRARLRAAMPEYMVPSRFVMLEALPRTHNGKLDRKVLPAPDDGDGSPRRVAVAPKTPTEEMVLGIFRSMLDRADFGVSDNFFDLGGHSLMAARLMARLRTESSVDIPLRDLFARPTVAGLAEAIDALRWLHKSNTPTKGNGVREEFVL